MSSQTLATLLKGHAGKEPIAPFPALVDSQPVNVRAVLERTAIVNPPHDDLERSVVRLANVIVEPALVVWKRDTGSRLSDNGAPFINGQRHFAGQRTAPKNAADRAEIRRLGDERALKDQADHARVPSVAKRKPNRSEAAKSRAKLVAQQLRRAGADKFCRSCRQVKPRAEFPDAGRGTHSCLACKNKTHCINGHELTPENTIITRRGKGWRVCRTCYNDAQREQRRREKRAA